MSFRNRPVFDRKHRPRWQDELRSQQLIVACFAVAIALALGIFGATVWSSYYEAHLRQVAEIDGTAFNRDALGTRAGIMASELSATGTELQSQLGGARDDVIKQQLDVINGQLQALSGDASNSLVLGAFLEHQAVSTGLSVSDGEINAEIARREAQPLRIKLSAITVNVLPADAKAGATPTDAQWAVAKKQADAILAQLRSGSDFAQLAKEKSSDAATKDKAGLIGWVGKGDAVYASLFDAAKDAKSGDLVGPVKGTLGYTLLHVDERKEAGPDKALTGLLDTSGVSDQQYRDFIRDELLRTKFQGYFANKVVKPDQPQRKIAQILIAPDAQGVPVPKLHLRHILIQPLPGAADQTKATPAQWKAALARATMIRVEAAKPDANWYELAKQSDDTSNKGRAGDLGMYDPASSTFVKEFKDAVRTLRVGDVSQPVRTAFGYHIIKVVGERITAQDQAGKLMKELRLHPDEFPALARDNSEDTGTAVNGGEVGWVAHYELPAAQDAAVFALKTKGQVSDPVVTQTGTYIYRLLDTSESMKISDSRLQQIKTTGFQRWLDEQKAGSQIWVDPEFAAPPASDSSTTSGTSPQG